MRLIVAGDCEKHDFILTVANLINSYYADQSVVIVTDNPRHYGYFQQMEIPIHFDLSIERTEDFIIYDLHNDLPDYLMSEDTKTVFATSFERCSIESATEFAKITTPLALLMIGSECSINEKYIRLNVPIRVDNFGYYDNATRRIDWVFDGCIRLTKLDKDFKEAVELYLTEIVEIPSKDLRKLWSFAMKRGK
ncbi:hypothetical protein EJP82_25930 [Paenibacillus anaericanus]|uniref:Uncharacterized protein n=1 Tax=Paenibacillus anaericanus TaxID=170367 RepID=A0A3S1DHK6_9BACL|nr:hypothetical protein [Paenibacillus anaericanus]RUT39522.1 hypothetical protein EJP82_25930 [Paenibacillus anaericanus]